MPHAMHVLHGWRVRALAPDRCSRYDLSALILGALSFLCLPHPLYIPATCCATWHDVAWHGIDAARRDMMWRDVTATCHYVPRHAAPAAHVAQAPVLGGLAMLGGMAVYQK